MNIEQFTHLHVVYGIDARFVLVYRIYDTFMYIYVKYMDGIYRYIDMYRCTP